MLLKQILRNKNKNIFGCIHDVIINSKCIKVSGKVTKIILLKTIMVFFVCAMTVYWTETFKIFNNVFVQH